VSHSRSRRPTPGPRRGRALAGALLAATVGAFALGLPADLATKLDAAEVPTPAAPVATPAAADALDPLQAALLAVQREVRPSAEPLPAGMTLPSFSEAVELLAEAQGPEGERSRELARLIVASGAFEVGTGGTVRWNDARVQAFTRLGGGSRDELVQAIRDDAAQSAEPDGKSDAPLGDRIAYRLLTQGCYLPHPRPTPSYDPETGIVRAMFRGVVTRGFDEVRRVGDPQNWARCNPSSFKESYAVDGENAAALLTGQPPRDETPPAPGSAWKAPFFEHFAVARPDGGTTSFRNLLCVDSQWISRGMPRRELRMDYGLVDSIDSQISVARGDGLELDCGYLEIREQGPRRTFLEGVKVLDFSPGAGADTDPERWAAFLLDEFWDFEVAKSLCHCAVDAARVPEPAPSPVALPASSADDLPPLCKRARAACS
jgi:hypothetical protein